jgi:hypothetical protein
VAVGAAAGCTGDPGVPDHTERGAQQRMTRARVLPWRPRTRAREP